MPSTKQRDHYNENAYEEKCKELRREEINILMEGIDNKSDVYLTLEAIWDYLDDYQESKDKTKVKEPAKSLINLLLDGVSSLGDVDYLKEEINKYESFYPDYQNDEDFLQIKKDFYEVKKREKLTKEFNFFD